MADLSSLSDEQLLAIVQGNAGAQMAPSDDGAATDLGNINTPSAPSLGDLSDAQLLEIINVGQAPTEWSPAGSVKNLGAGIVEGAVGLGSLALDAVLPKPGSTQSFLSSMNPFRSFFESPEEMKARLASDYEREKKQQGLFWSGEAKKGLAEVLPAPEDQYRYARRTGQFVGGSLPFGPGAIAAGVPGGLGAQTAADLTGDEYVAPIVGGILGGSIPSAAKNLFGAVKSIFVPPSPQQIKGSAAQSFKSSTGLTPQQIEAGIAGRPKDALGNYMTTAEVTGNPGVAQLEKSLGSAGDNAARYKQLGGLRQNAREGIVQDMSSTEAITPETLGQKLMTRAENRSEAMGKVAKKKWGQFDRNLEIPVENNQVPIERLINAKQGGSPINRTVQLLVDQFSDAPTKSSGALQDIRQEALDLLRTNTKLTGYERRILATLSDEIDDAMGRGLTGKDYDAYVAARNATKLEKTTFKRGTAGGSLTSDAARPSNALRLALKGDKRSIEEIKAAIGKSPALIEDLKRGVLDLIPRDAKQQITAAGMNKFLKANRGALEELFGKEHHRKLLRIADDLRSEAAVADTAFYASKGNSVTQQRQTVAGTIAENIISATNPIGGVVGRMLDELKGLANINTRAQIEDLLFRAALNPEYALDLAKTPTKVRVMSLLDRIIDTAKQSAGAGARAGIAELGGNAPPEKLERQKLIINKTPITKGDTMTTDTKPPQVTAAPIKQDVAAIEQEIDKDPYMSALYEAESGRNPLAKNPTSSASGAFQLINSTAKNLGVEDPFDMAQNYAGALKLTDTHRAKFGNDPAKLYMAHYLGETVLRKLLNRQQLSAKEQAQVDYLQKKALPDFLKIYNRKVGLVEA